MHQKQCRCVFKTEFLLFWQPDEAHLAHTWLPNNVQKCYATNPLENLNKLKFVFTNLKKCEKKQASERLSFVKEADINLKIEAAVIYYSSAAAFAPYPFL